MYNQRTSCFFMALRVMDINKFASEQLATARYKARLSFDELAVKTGISKSSLNRLLNGQQKSMPLEAYLLILKACGQSEREYLVELIKFSRSKTKK